MIETRFNVCDLNAIETRCGAYVAECTKLMNVFQPYTDPTGHFHRNGKDPYLYFAVDLYGIPYEKLFMDKEGHNGKEAKNNAKRMRQISKPGVLAAIYRMAGGDWGNGKASFIDHVEDCLEAGKKTPKCSRSTCPKVYDRIRTGLWGYAKNMGVDMEQKEANKVVSVFRNAYPEICGNGYGGQEKGIWVRLEEAVMDVMQGTNTVRRIGPNGCITIDKVNLEGRNALLRIHLPSGRKLHYVDAFIADALMPWLDKEGNPVYRPALHYWQENDKNQWVSITTHGGKIFENIVQGIARDVLGYKLIAFEENDLPCIGHVHDEGIVLVPNDPFSRGVDEMVNIMSEPLDWAPGLLLGADGFEGSFYHK